MGILAPENKEVVAFRSRRSDKPGRRWLRVGLYLVLGGLVSSIVVALIVVWRLLRGPLVLNPLTPYLERSVSRQIGLPVKIASTELALGERRRSLDLRVRDVELLRENGQSVAFLPAVALRLSMTALLRRSIALEEVELLGPRLRLARGQEGGLELGVGPEASATQAATGSTGLDPGAATAALARVFGSSLRLVAIRHGAVEYVDGPVKGAWRASGVDLAAWREGEEIAATLAGDVALDGDSVPLEVRARSPLDGRKIQLDVSFGSLDPAALAAQLSPRMAAAAWLARLKLPVRGAARLVIDGRLGRLGPDEGRIELHGARGALSLPELFPADVPVERVEAAVTLKPATEQLELERLVIELGDARIESNGTLTGLGTPQALTLLAATRDLTLGAIVKHWPPRLAGRVRGWLESNLSAGRISAAEIQLGAKIVGADAAGRLEVTDLRGSIGFDGLNLRYLESMPRLSDLAGQGTFSKTAWDFRIDRGALSGLELTQGRVALSGIGGRAPYLTVDTWVGGPLDRMLEVLDHPPLEITSALGLSPAAVSGTVTGWVRFGMPLSGRSPRPAEVRGWAQMSEVASSNLRGFPVSDGKLELDLDESALRLAGAVRVAGESLAITWQESLSGPESGKRQIRAEGRVDAGALSVLGMGLESWVRGPVDLVAAWVEPRTGPADVKITGDLARTTIASPATSLEKPEGAPGRVEARLTLVDGVLTAVPQLRLELTGASVKARATRSPSGASWEEIDVTATLAPVRPGGSRRSLELTVRPAKPAHRFVLRANDAGTLLFALGKQVEGRGGPLRFDGTVDLAAPGLRLDGHAEVDGLTLTKAPVLARLATLASLSGIASAMTGRGIDFRRVTADIHHREGVITIADLIATGPALDLSLGGTIDRAAGVLALQGVVVPSYYGVNTAVDRIPLVGKAITGRGSRGLQAFRFQARGPLADPIVSVDPLSSLTPGALRDLIPRIDR